MTYYDHNERILFGVKGLSLIGKGLWPGDFASLHTVLMQFSERNHSEKFGNYSCRLQIRTNRDRELITTRAGNECLWLVEAYWDTDGDVPLTEDVEDGKKYPIYPKAPNGKVLGTKITTQTRLELWHDANNIDAVATKAYMSKLYRKLIEDGLRPIEGSRMEVNQIFSDGLKAALENGYYEGDFPPVKSLVKEFRYPGELHHFRAFMKRLIDSELAYWEASNGVWLECQDTFPPDPTTPVGRWHIRTQLTSNLDAWATMIAYGEKADETHVCFYDGFNSISEPHERPQLGSILLEFTDFIENQAVPVSTRQKLNEQTAVPEQPKLSGGKERKIILQSKKPGRKPNPLYDEAFKRICEGQDEKEVFKWYCEEAGWNDPGKTERDAFKAAMKRRRKGT